MPYILNDANKPVLVALDSHELMDATNVYKSIIEAREAQKKSCLHETMLGSLANGQINCADCGMPGSSIQAASRQATDEASPEYEQPEHPLVSHLIRTWVDSHGRPAPWAVAIEILATITKMPDSEKAAMLALDDDDDPGEVERLRAEVQRLRCTVLKECSTTAVPSSDVIDLGALAWQQISEAAGRSSWMPKEYMQNDWLSDVCRFLEHGPAAFQRQGEPVAVIYADGSVLTKADCGEAFDTCCKVETPLYTHPYAGEVEQGYSHEVVQAMQSKNDTLRADLESVKSSRDAFAQNAIDLRAQLAEAQDKINKAWNKGHSLDYQGHIPGALDAWKRPVKQHLPYDFSGNPGASATQYCNGWNDAGGYWKNYADRLEAQLAEQGALLRTVLDAFEGAEGHPWMPGHVADTIKPMVAAALSASAERTCDICNGTRRVKEPGCEEGDCTRCTSAEPSIPKYHRSPLGMTEEIRRRLTLIAREAAISSTHRYNYMPTTPKDALLWQPHAWVLAAMRMVELSASAAPEQKS